MAIRAIVDFWNVKEKLPTATISDDKEDRKCLIA